MNMPQSPSHTGMGSPGDDPASVLALRPPVPWWRWLVVGLFRTLLFSLLLSAASYVYYRYQAESAWRAAVQELDERDPSWRWEAIQAARPAVPVDKNALVEVRRLQALLPKDWPAPPPGKLPAGRFVDALRNERCTPAQQGELDELLQAPGVPAARQGARGLIRWPQGRIDVEMDMHYPLQTQMPDHVRLRTVARLLMLDALDRAEKGEREEAMASIGAMHALSRTLDDDPFLLGQYVRMAVIAQANTATQRVLALGEVRDATLAQLQADLRHQLADRRIEQALRTERWMTLHCLEQLTKGTLKVTTILEREEKTVLDTLANFFVSEKVRFEILPFVRLSERHTEIARLPFPEQFEAEEIYRRHLPKQIGMYTRSVTSLLTRTTETVRRHHASATALHTLLGVERYRLRHGKWPAKLDDCVPAFLDRVPLDPINNARLSYKILPDGVVVYSIGNDRRDDAGDTTATPPRDFGYRLWNKDRRGIAPPPPDEAHP